MTDTTNITITAGLELARKLLNDDRAAFAEYHSAPSAGDRAIADDYTAAITAITGAAAELQRLTAQLSQAKEEIVDLFKLAEGYIRLSGERFDQTQRLIAERNKLADALHKARSSVQWRDGRLNQLQIAQLRMRDPERTMVCDILANGTLLEPEGSRYAITDAAAELRTEHAQRVTLQHRAADLAQRVADLEDERSATAMHVAFIGRLLGDKSLQVDDIAAGVWAVIVQRDELAAKLAEIERAEPVAWSPALTHTDYEKARVWCNGKPRDEDVAYWKSQGIGITLAYSHPTAPQPVAVPAGWKLVPVEPTPEMVQAANDGDDEYTLRGFGPGVQRVMQGPEDHYAAMLAAAPQPPAADHCEDVLEMVPARPCRCGPDGCPDSTACPREGGAA
jgi:hypothetical protein